MHISSVNPGYTVDSYMTVSPLLRTDDISLEASLIAVKSGILNSSIGVGTVTIYIFESSIPIDRTKDYKWLKNGDIVECMYVTWEDGPLWWKPLKKRTDKTFPNSRRTFYRTLVNIKENIMMKEFLDCRPK